MEKFGNEEKIIIEKSCSTSTKWDYQPSQAHNYSHTQMSVAISQSIHRCLLKSCVLSYLSICYRFPFEDVSRISLNKNFPD